MKARYIQTTFSALRLLPLWHHGLTVCLVGILEREREREKDSNNNKTKTGEREGERERRTQTTTKQKQATNRSKGVTKMTT